MKSERIFNAVGKISDELIEDAAISNQHSKKHFPWKALVASAACFCLLLTAVFSMPYLFPNTPDDILPGITNPSSPTSQGNAERYVPFLSAYDVAGVLTSLGDRNETNAYTVNAYPKDYLAKVLSLPSSSSVTLYSYQMGGLEPDQASIQTLSEKVFATLAKYLEITIPEVTFKKDNADAAGSNYFYYGETEKCTVIAEQYSLTERIAVLAAPDKTDNVLAFNKTAVRINPLLGDDEIMAQFTPAAQMINEAFGTSFDDMAIARSYDEYSPNGINSVRIFLYDKENEPNDRISEIPMSDYILIEFYDMRVNGDDNEIHAGFVSYIHYRVPVENRLIQICEEPMLTLEQAEDMLKKGYVFGGHSCSLCMQAQEKVDFSEYDYVGLEYVMSMDGSEGVRLCVPFYAFYKKLESAPNGNETYAKTYVCAVPMTDIDTYFEMQTTNHS